MRDSLIYMYNDRSLGADLILCLFTKKKKKLLGSPLESMICLLIGYWPSNSADMGFILQVNLTSNQKVVSYSFDICATIIPVGMPSQAGCCCHSQVSHLGKLMFIFSPPVAWIALSNTTKASQERWNFKVNTGLIPLFYDSSVCFLQQQGFFRAQHGSRTYELRLVVTPCARLVQA